MKSSLIRRLGLLAAVGVSSLLISACGGGGGSTPPVGGGLTPAFTAGAPTPPANSITMQPGAVNSDLFDVRIVGTDINDLFSAMFSVSYNASVADFVSSDFSSSVLSGAGVSTTFQATEVSPGVVEVTAARQTGSPGGVGFAAASPTPGAGTISLQPGNVNGTQFTVLVRATDITDLFGTAFRVTFDPASADYVSFDSSGSVLAGGGAQTQFSVGEVSTGEIAVGATRLQNQAGTVPGVNVSGTQTILALTFDATALTAGNTFTLAMPREACNSSSPSGGCTPISVTWSGGTMTNTAGDTGVNTGAAGEIVTLRFRATQATAGSAFTFADPREVCSSAGLPGCSAIAVTYDGGTLVAN